MFNPTSDRVFIKWFAPWILVAVLYAELVGRVLNFPNNIDTLCGVWMFSLLAVCCCHLILELKDKPEKKECQK